MTHRNRLSWTIPLSPFQRHSPPRFLDPRGSGTGDGLSMFSPGGKHTRDHSFTSVPFGHGHRDILELPGEKG